jgi:peptidoglycan hydrolase-like protein with peptidoglycan-binding domain
VRVAGFISLLLTLAVSAATANAAGDARVAAVQVALHQRHLYDGTIDGVAGPVTRHAVLRLQLR